MEQVDAELRDTMRNLCAGKTRWPMLLHGSAGTGKTLAALCLADMFIGDCEYTTLQKMHTEIAQAMRGELYTSRGDKIWPDSVWANWTRAALGILDELGTRNQITDAAYETLKRMIDDREAKPTIYISNHSPNELKVMLDDRLMSRITCGTQFELVGEDRRRHPTGPDINDEPTREEQQTDWAVEKYRLNELRGQIRQIPEDQFDGVVDEACRFISLRRSNGYANQIRHDIEMLGRNRLAEWPGYLVRLIADVWMNFRG